MQAPWRRRNVGRRRSETPRAKRTWKLATVVALALAFVLVLGGTAFADFSPVPGVTITPGGESCNGIIPTPGSENTVKTLVGGTLVPGGTAQYQISYPVDASHIGDEWEIVDCVLIGSGTDLKTYDVLDEATFSGVINSTSFLLAFTFNIPSNATLGDRICNVAKTTQGPSAPQSSNRKAGPACFIIGGDARVEKHSTTDPNGPVIPGATFVVNNCVNTSLTPSIQPLLVNGVAIVPGPGTLTITNSTGVISFGGADGSHCDVTETVPPPGYSLPAITTQTVTINSAEQTIVKFLDPPAPGNLLISKVAPASQQATVFTFNVSCTNPTNNYTTTITGTGTSQISGIPAGSVCTVAEVVPAGFNPPLYSPSNTVTIVSGQTVTITVTNSLAPGALAITKVAPVGSQQTFTFHIACTNPVNTYTLTITGSGTATQSGIPAGSVCTVTEDVLSGFAQPVFSPVGPYTIGPAQTVAVTVTNTLLPGSLTINKIAPAGSTATFTFNVVCTNPSNTYQLQVIGSGSVTQTGIPAGSVCTITEVLPAGYAQPQFSPSNIVTISAASASSVTVTNTLLPGSLTISKVAPAEAQDEDFDFSVVCTLNGAISTFPTVTITGTDTATIDNIAAGSVCTVTEINLPDGFDTPTYSPPGGIVTVPGGAAAASTVTVTNSLLPLAIRVEKTASTVGGAPGLPVTYTYRITNIGKVDLVNVVVTDDKLGPICTLDSLLVDETKTCTESTTLPNVAGALTNVATAVGTDRFGRTTSDIDDATVSVVLPKRVERPLPRTGASTVPLMWLGLGLLALGFVTMRFGARPSLAAVAAASSSRPGGYPGGLLASGGRRWSRPGGSSRAGPRRRFRR